MFFTVKDLGSYMWREVSNRLKSKLPAIAAIFGLVFVLTMAGLASAQKDPPPQGSSMSVGAQQQGSVVEVVRTHLASAISVPTADTTQPPEEPPPDQMPPPDARMTQIGTKWCDTNTLGWVIVKKYILEECYEWNCCDLLKGKGGSSNAVYGGCAYQIATDPSGQQALKNCIPCTEANNFCG